MSKLVDEKGRMVEVELTGKNGIDWSDDFYEVGTLEYDEENDAYKVEDVEYCIDQAEDWKNCTGDWAMQESHDGEVYVTWIVWDNK